MKFKVPFITSNEDEVRVVEILIKNGEKIKKKSKNLYIRNYKNCLWN